MAVSTESETSAGNEAVDVEPRLSIGLCLEAIIAKDDVRVALQADSRSTDALDRFARRLGRLGHSLDVVSGVVNSVAEGSSTRTRQWLNTFAAGRSSVSGWSHGHGEGQLADDTRDPTTGLVSEQTICTRLKELDRSNMVPWVSLAIFDVDLVGLGPLTKASVLAAVALEVRQLCGRGLPIGRLGDRIVALVVDSPEFGGYAIESAGRLRVSLGRCVDHWIELAPRGTALIDKHLREIADH